MSKDGVSRRGVFRVLIGAVAVTVAALLYPVVRFLRPRRGGDVGNLTVVAPYRANELRADADGKWPGPFNFGGRPCLLIKTDEGEIKAFDAICTHTDCTVAFRPQEQDILCACHTGIYDLAGRNVKGPPPRPLTEYKVELRGKPGQEEIVVSKGN